MLSPMSGIFPIVGGLNCNRRAGPLPQKDAQRDDDSADDHHRPSMACHALFLVSDAFFRSVGGCFVASSAVLCNPGARGGKRIGIPLDAAEESRDELEPAKCAADDEQGDARRRKGLVPLQGIPELQPVQGSTRHAPSAASPRRNVVN
jgi:hypothetical protein